MSVKEGRFQRAGCQQDRQFRYRFRTLLFLLQLLGDRPTSLGQFPADIERVPSDWILIGVGDEAASQFQDNFQRLLGVERLGWPSPSDAHRHRSKSSGSLTTAEGCPTADVRQRAISDDSSPKLHGRAVSKLLAAEFQIVGIQVAWLLVHCASRP